MRVKQTYFDVFAEFLNASYADRTNILLTKLVRERKYDSTCLLVSPPSAKGHRTILRAQFRAVLRQLHCKSDCEGERLPPDPLKDTRDVTMIESSFILAVAVWLIRIGRDLQRLAEQDTPPITTHREPSTVFGIGRN